MVVLSQLTRAPEREDRKPQLSDLRESGAIEQDADVVLFINRPNFYKTDIPEEDRAKAELIIAKQRNGPTGSLNFVFLGRHTRFEEAAPDAWSAGGERGVMDSGCARDSRVVSVWPQLCRFDPRLTKHVRSTPFVHSVTPTSAFSVICAALAPVRIVGWPACLQVRNLACLPKRCEAMYDSDFRRPHGRRVWHSKWTWRKQ